MTSLTPNQGIVTQVGTDPANLPNAQAAWDGVMENRLAQRYTNEADRTARNAAPNENELSALAAEDRFEIYNTAAWVSVYTRGLFHFVRRTVDAAAINNSTVLVNDTVLTTTLPAVTGVYCWVDTIFVDGSATGDFKVAYTWPGGGSAGKWGAMANATTATTGIGDANTNVTTTSGTSQPYGMNAVGSQVMLIIHGEIALAGTGGTLVLQYAQQTADPTNTIVRTGTRRELWRVS